MKKKVLGILFGALLLSSVYSQGSDANVKKEYEYLVYSFGKTYFDDVSPEDRYYSFLYSADQGKNLNDKLNQLGRLGWELIDVLGSIGGDQQVVFIRPIGLITNEQENEIINQLIVEEQEKMMNLIASKNPDSKIPLVETDNRDWNIEYSKNNELFMEEVNRITGYINTCKGVTEATNNNNIYSPKINIKLDLTEQLLKGNEYSLSKTKDYVTAFFRDIRKQVQFDKFVYYSHDITLDLKVLYSYEGESYEVYQEEYKIEKSYK